MRFITQSKLWQQLKGKVELFFADRLPAERKLQWIMDKTRPDIEAIIESEEGIVSQTDSETARLYYNALEETMRWLQISNQQEELDRGFLIIEKIFVSQQFDEHKYELYDFVHTHHEVYIKMSRDLEKTINNF